MEGQSEVWKREMGCRGGGHSNNEVASEFVIFFL